MRYIFLPLFVLIFLTNNTLAAGVPDSLEQENEKLKLMFQVFSYSSDLKNAYKVGKRALKKYPESIYWHRKMAEVSQWLDRRDEAIRHYEFIYSKTHDKLLEKKILSYALNSYQYETAAPILRSIAQSDPTPENIEKMIDIYDKTGLPEIAARTLEELFRSKKIEARWLGEALRIYADTGDIKSAQRIATEMQQAGRLGPKASMKLSDYYISRKKMQKSFDVLKDVELKGPDKDLIAYYKRLSDVGWYLQELTTAAKASVNLYNMGEGRLIDYERILYYYNGKDPDFVEKVAYDGYMKFGKEHLYLAYIDTLFTEKKYRELESIFDKEEKNASLGSNVYLWLIKGQVYSLLDKYEKAAEAFGRAVQLDSNSVEARAAVLWFYIDNHNATSLEKIIFEIEEGGRVDPELWLPLAVGNFSLQRSDRAMEYVKRLLYSDKSSVDVKFMYAYIMQAREETDAFMKMMAEIFEELKEELRHDPNMIKDRVFLANYLKAGMYFIDVDKYEYKLKRSEAVLGQKTYTEISILWALRHNAHDRARYLEGRLEDVEPWMKLNIALSDDARADQLDILYRYSAILPARDKVLAGVETGNISLAQTLSFEGRRYNRYDYLLYRQRLELVEEYADVVDIKGGLQQRSDLVRSYARAAVRYYIADAWALHAGVEHVDNSADKGDTFVGEPGNDSSFELGLKKRFMRGYVDVAAGVRSAMDDYVYFKAAVHYNVMSRLALEAGYGNRIKSEETNYLLLGGDKDELSAKVYFQYLNSSMVSLSAAYQSFHSQDDIYLGKGFKARFDLYRQFRNGYPDLAWGLFAEYGSYRESGASRGVIDHIAPENALILPETYYTVGANFFYGTVNRQRYTRVWRPYAEFAPYYNGFSNQFNFSCSAGYGGALFGEDHLSVGIFYDQSVNGTNESNLEFYARYKFFL
ncbi:MAG: hypothetical protein B5M52_00125 [Helicobacteraceae bacterium 4484_230]|nr:MAG: hypothetical protein B5M52_00125 [Helicobacteraceae bacterium 4484_230]